jgi:hypothetical protein
MLPKHYFTQAYQHQTNKRSPKPISTLKRFLYDGPAPTQKQCNVWHWISRTKHSLRADTSRRRSIGLNLRFPDSLYAAGDEQAKRYHLGKRTVKQYSHRCGMQPLFVTTFFITGKSSYNYKQQTNLLKSQSKFYVNTQFEHHREQCVILVERPSVNVV